MATMPIPMGGQGTMFGSPTAPGTFNYGGSGISGTPATGQGGTMPSLPPAGGPITTNPTGIQGGGSTVGGAPILWGGQPPTGPGGTFSMSGGTASPTPAPPTVSNAGGIQHMPPQQAYAATGTPMPTPTGVQSGQQYLDSLTGATSNPTSTVPGQNNQATPSPNSYDQTTRQQTRTLGELQSEYGEGMGSLLYSLLQTGGINLGILNSTDAAEIQAMQGQINMGAGNLNNILGAQGISGNSSSSIMANTQYQEGATAEENSLIAKNYLQQYDVGQQLLSQILGDTSKTAAQNTANQPNWEDYLGMGLNVATGGLSGLASSIFGGSSGGGGGITSADAAGILDL